MTINPNRDPVDLSEEGLMAAAQRQTGLSDWGDLDFREGRRVLLDACRQEADLSLVGQQWLQRECIQSLSSICSATWSAEVWAKTFSCRLVADRWMEAYQKDFLGEMTWEVAEPFGYQRIADLVDSDPEIEVFEL